MKILAQRPTHISVVATVILITKTFTVKYYDRRIQTIIASITTTTAIIIIHIKRDSDCNGNEKDNIEKQLEGKVRERERERVVIYRESRGKGGTKLSLRKQQNKKKESVGKEKIKSYKARTS